MKIINKVFNEVLHCMLVLRHPNISQVKITVQEMDMILTTPGISILLTGVVTNWQIHLKVTRTSFFFD